jgi:hypothetical protein
MHLMTIHDGERGGDMLGEYFQGHAEVEVEGGWVWVRLREGSGTNEKAVFRLNAVVAANLAKEIQWGADRASLSVGRARIVENIIAAVALPDPEKQPGYVYR